MSVLDELCASRSLGTLLEGLRERYGTYELVACWPQGELHNDLVLRLSPAGAAALAPVVLVSANCNGGIKEVLGFDETPDCDALWHQRCPDNPGFQGELPAIRFSLRTEHWSDPCELVSGRS